MKTFFINMFLNREIGPVFGLVLDMALKSLGRMGWCEATSTRTSIRLRPRLLKQFIPKKVIERIFYMTTM